MEHAQRDPKTGVLFFTFGAKVLILILMEHAQRVFTFGAKTGAVAKS